MKKFPLVVAIVAALTLIGAPSMASAAEPIHLPAPTQNADCSITVPEVEGVTYGVYDYTGTTGTGWIADTANNYNWQPGDDIIVIASYSNWSPFGDDPIDAENPSGYDTDGNPGWWFDNSCVITVTAPAPTWTDPAGPGNLQAHYTNTDAYYYVERRYSTGKLQVTAKARYGYVLTGTTQWQKLDR